MTKKIMIGLIDYGFGNQNSVIQAIRSLGYRCITTSDKKILNNCDVLILPGVGAFPSAMKSLNSKKLTDFIKKQALNGKPIIGICLGMQLLTESSTEIELTKGLGLIPGHTVAMPDGGWHIGWNDIHTSKEKTIIHSFNNQSFYFNHSHIVRVPAKYRLATSIIREKGPSFTIAIKNKNIIGVQFHPEKSQTIGKLLLTSIIETLVHA